MQQRNDNANQCEKYDYSAVTSHCKKKVLGKNLLNVGASYLSILLNENHWIGCTISNECSEILLQDQCGKDVKNRVVLNNLLWLVGGEFGRLNDCSKNKVDEF